MFKNKNDYSLVAFFLQTDWNGKPKIDELGKPVYKVLKLEYVHNCYQAVKWIESKGDGNWTYINVYNRRSKDFIIRFDKGDFIIPKPK